MRPGVRKEGAKLLPKRLQIAAARLGEKGGFCLNFGKGSETSKPPPPPARRLPGPTYPGRGDAPATSCESFWIVHKPRSPRRCPNAVRSAMISLFSSFLRRSWLACFTPPTPSPAFGFIYIFQSFTLVQPHFLKWLFAGPQIFEELHFYWFDFHGRILEKRPSPGFVCLFVFIYS